MIGKLVSRYRVWLIFFVPGIVLAAVLAYLHFTRGMVWADWTGFGDYSGPLAKDYRGKTLWDVLELLIVPAALALTALWFSNQEKKADREAEERRTEVDRTLAKDRMQEQTLQSYLDTMTVLLLEKGLRESEEKYEVRVIARARTLTTLKSLNGQRRGQLLSFLKELKLIERGNTLVNLKEANLAGVQLKGANLRNVNLVRCDLTEAYFADASLNNAYLMGANLTDADLTGAVLREAVLWSAVLKRARLTGANLTRASLKGADLVEADLYSATLEGADLSGANLFDTRLAGANLIGAEFEKADLTGADLSYANLTSARITLEQLSTAASLQGATLPDGSKHE